MEALGARGDWAREAEGYILVAEGYGVTPTGAATGLALVAPRNRLAVKPTLAIVCAPGVLFGW